jgi:deoxyadenosine/deoxycytidine kinase
VEGPIGVGKTVLAKRLAQALGGRLIAEPVDQNPFLKSFYQDQAKFAFQTQISFLIIRYQQQKDLCQQDLFCGVTVSDYLFAKDKIFAHLNLDEDELTLYNQIYQLLDKRLPTPDLVVYLQASPEVLRERIQRRKREFELGIRGEYLEALNQAYNRFFFHYNQSPLLVVNTSQIDFVESAVDFNHLLEKIKKVKSGCEYFNPLGSGKKDRDGKAQRHSPL